jgi:hypothetical protein
MGLPVQDSISLTLVFALTSNNYSLIGISFASIIDDVTIDKFRLILIKIGSIGMVGVGIYFMFKALTVECPNGFGI